MTQATTYSVPTVGPASPTVMAQRIDDNFDAIISGHSGSTRPAYAVAGMIWEDTSVAGEMRLWFYDGTQDILVAVVDTANDRVELAPQPLVDVASAATTDLGAVKSRNIRVTGTTTITSFGTIRAGTTKTVYFAAALTVTYNATSLITPTGASLALAAGDSIDLVSLGSGNWRVLRHVKRSNLVKFGSLSLTSGTAADFTGLPAGLQRLVLVGRNVTVSANHLLVGRMGTSGGIVSTGYTGNGSVTTQSSGVGVSAEASGIPLDTTSGSNFIKQFVMEIVRGDLNEWSYHAHVHQASDRSLSAQGSVDLGAEVNQFRVTTVAGTPAFTAGKITLYGEF